MNDDDDARAVRGAWRGLGVLILVGLYTYADRQIIGLQGEPIRQALGLGDLQFGIVQGAGIALITAFVGYPIGWLADRMDRRRVLAACLAVWCVAVALCGAATSFTELVVAGALVGAAEAGLLPIAYASIPAWFRGRARQSANSCFVVLGRLAAGLVIVGCGWLIASIDDWKPLLPAAWQATPTWRLALWATSLPGLVLVLLVLKLPDMRGARPAAWSMSAVPPDSIGKVLRDRAGVLLPCFLGAGLLAFGANAVGTFVPVAAARQWGIAPLEAGRGLGLAALVAAAVALLASLVLNARADVARRPSVALACAAAAMAASALTLPLLSLAAEPWSFFAAYGSTLAFTMTAVMLLPTALQPICPGPQRVRLMSLYVGSGIVMAALGPAAVGALSDARGGSASALLVSMMWPALLAHAACAGCLLWSAWCCALLPGHLMSQPATSLDPA